MQVWAPPRIGFPIERQTGSVHSPASYRSDFSYYSIYAGFALLPLTDGNVLYSGVLTLALQMCIRNPPLHTWLDSRVELDDLMDFWYIQKKNLVRLTENLEHR